MAKRRRDRARSALEPTPAERSTPSPAGLRRGVRSELAPLLVIAALSVGMIWRVTLAGRVMAPGDLLLIMEPWRHSARQLFPEFQRPQNPILDGIQQFYPWRKFAGESLRNGILPLWNPHELCGTPFIANNQSAAFYPETWLHALLRTDRALGWATALHFFTSGALMYWFLRALALRRTAALLGAIAFMFNGFVVGWLCFPSFRSVPAWLPGMLIGVEMAARTRRMSWLALAALFVGLQFLAGNLHISLLVLIVFAAYVLFRSAQAFRVGDRGVAGWLLEGGVAAAVVGGLLAAGQLLPVVELAPVSSRAGGIPYTEILKLATPAPLLLTGLLPDIFGNPADYNHWGAELGPVYRAYTETTWYVGVLPWLIGAAGLLGRLRSQAWFWLGLLVLGVVWAIGTPAYALFYYLVPGAPSLSGLGRAILLSSTALCVLAGLGLDALLDWCRDHPARVRKHVAAAAAVVGLVGLIGGALVWVRSGALEESLPGIGGYTSLQLGRFALLLALTAGLLGLLPTRRRFAAAGLVALLAVDLYVGLDKFTPAVPREFLHVSSRTVDLIRADPDPVRVLSLGTDAVRRMAPNTPMIAELHDIQGSDSLEIGASRRLVNALSTDRLGFLQPDPALPAVALLGAKYVHSAVDLGEVPGLTLISSGEGWLYRNERAMPRAFGGWAWEVVTTPDEVLRRMAAPDYDPHTVVTVGRLPHAGVATAEPPTFTVSYSGPQRATIRGSLNPGQLVVLTDTHYPGWRAFQGSRECPVLPVNFALRGVAVETSGETLELVYLPASFRAGLFMALCAAGLLAGIGASAAAGRRRCRP